MLSSAVPRSRDGRLTRPVGRFPCSRPRLTRARRSSKLAPAASNWRVAPGNWSDEALQNARRPASTAPGAGDWADATRADAIATTSRTRDRIAAYLMGMRRWNRTFSRPDETGRRRHDGEQSWTWFQADLKVGLYGATLRVGLYGATLRVG